MQQNLVEGSRIVLDERKRLTISGVQSVDGFSEQYLNLTINGNKVRVLGEKIKISAFNKSNGNFSADGLFFEIRFIEKKQPVTKRLFK